MANPEHLTQLQEGVAAWNTWRASSADTVPDLSEAFLRDALLEGMNLRKADLKKADLSGANLSKADLTGADLRFAYLFGADLDSAILDGADLHGAILKEANLSEANLTGAHLGDANLSGANVDGANFHATEIAYSNFGNTNVGRAVGLEYCSHSGPSYLDYFTLARSWPLPPPFLRGCGLPDDYIEYLPSLLNQAIQYYSCFISHSTKDKEIAERIWGDLQNKNVRCRYAPEDLKIGDRFQERIEESIRVHDKLLLVLTENSVDSAWVEREVLAAREREDRTGKLLLFPIRVDDAVMGASKAWAADLRRTRHIGDFTDWKDHDSYQKAFERLLRDLKAEGAADSTSASK